MEKNIKDVALQGEGSSDKSRVNEVTADSPAQVTNSRCEIKQLLEEKGFCILTLWDNKIESFLCVANMLGRIQRHVRSKGDGSVDILPSDNSYAVSSEESESWMQHRDQYLGTTNKKMSPHTDGSYLHGLKIEDGLCVVVGPPKFILLQCVRPASKGEGNILIDSREIFRELVHREPGLARILMTPGCISFCRDDQIALERAVYEAHPSGRYRIRFRFDFTTYAPEWAIPSLERFVSKYYSNPIYRTYISLRENQILVLDNFRMLHGRPSFPPVNGHGSRRFLRRLWISDDRSEELRNVAGETTMARAFERWKFYAETGDHSDKAFPGILAGIELDNSTQEAIDTFFTGRL